MNAIRILLIEDDPDISDLLQAALEPTFECLRATNGLEGLQIALAGQPDLIISDIMMPIMDGYEFIRRLRKDPSFAETPVIFLSALGTREKIRAGYDLGAALYLTKPIDPIRMRRNVELFVEDHGIAPNPKQRSVKEVQAALAEKADGKAPPSESPVEAEAHHPPEEPQRTEPKAQPAPARASSATGTESKKQSPKRPRIMVVEDDRECIEMLREELGALFEFIPAFDGIEAIERAVKYEPDIFVIDGMLPKMTGYQLVTMLRKNRVFAEHPIVMVSAKATNRDRQYIEKLGVKYFLAKPFEVGDLKKKVQEIAESPDFLIASKKFTERQMNLETLRDFESHR